MVHGFNVELGHTKYVGRGSSTVEDVRGTRASSTKHQERSSYVLRPVGV